MIKRLSSAGSTLPHESLGFGREVYSTASHGYGPFRDAWLVVVDLQHAFLNPSSDWYIPSAHAVLEPTSHLVTAFGRRVVHTRFVPDEKPTGSWRMYYEYWPFAASSRSAELWELAVPWRSTSVVSSGRFSKWGALCRFWNRIPRTIVVCGVATDVCVLATCLEAIDDGAAVVVVDDCCAAGTKAAHARGLQILRGRRGQIYTHSVAETMNWIRATGEGRRARRSAGSRHCVEG